MPQPEDLSIERQADLDLSTTELWALIATPEGWACWLVDDTDVDIAPDANGTATHDGVERAVRIDSVIDGHEICFSWWDRGDPSSTSFVRLDVVELPEGRSQLRITERFLGATASATMSCSVGWEVRLVSLWLRALPSLVPSAFVMA